MSKKEFELELLAFCIIYGDHKISYDEARKIAVEEFKEEGGIWRNS